METVFNKELTKMPRGHGRGFGMGPGWWHGRFRGCGYRITIPRQEILKVLNQTEEHLSAEEIYLRVHKVYPSVGLTTVYRTLEVLADMGLVFRLEFGDGKARYELVEGPKGKLHHHHLVCTDCGRVIDYTDFISEEKELLDKTEKALSSRHNFKILNHQIHFYGLCNKCK